MPKLVNEIIIADEIIMNKIYVIRDQKVMIDRDLAELYGVQAIRLREQVKRNIDRFPENSVFGLTTEEVETMVSQNAIHQKNNWGDHCLMLLLNMGF